jgi:RNA polymerase sigma factor (sigma-70 family)
MRADDQLRKSDESSGAFTTNATLFLRIKATDPQPREIAWEEFRGRYAPMIAGFARNLGARPQDVDDLIQDVLMGFFALSPAFVYDPAKGRFRGYLKVCTFRALRQRLGQNARFKAIPLDNVDPESLDVEQVWNDVWEQEQLRRALEAAREAYNGSSTFRAFELYVILGKPPGDVAQELGLNINSVYKAKERVTQLLRQKLKELGEQQG